LARDASCVERVKDSPPHAVSAHSARQTGRMNDVGGSGWLPYEFMSGSRAPIADLELGIASPICCHPAEFRLA